MVSFIFYMHLTLIKDTGSVTGVIEFLSYDVAVIQWITSCHK